MLQSMRVTMYNLITYLKNAGKLHSCFNQIEPNIIIDIYIENFAGRKINDEEKIQMEISKSSTKPIYKTQKGYKSNKLDNLFNDYYKFLTCPNESVETFISNEKLYMIQEKYNLDFDNPERDESKIILPISKLTELFIEASKKNPQQEFHMSNEQLKIIL